MKSFRIKYDWASHQKYYLSRCIRKPTVCICETKGAVQPQRQYNSSHKIINFKNLACFCGCAAWFVLDLVGNQVLFPLCTCILSQFSDIFIWPNVNERIVSAFINYYINICICMTKSAHIIRMTNWANTRITGPIREKQGQYRKTRPI